MHLARRFLRVFRWEGFACVIVCLLFDSFFFYLVDLFGLVGSMFVIIWFNFGCLGHL